MNKNASDHIRAETILLELSSLPVIKEILYRLERELPSSLYYHNIAHTLDVLEQSIKLALQAAEDPRRIELLAIAAAYHDAGYLVSVHNNESIGAEMAAEAMRAQGGYSETEVDLVSSLILDTSMLYTERGPKQMSSNALSKYLLDADMYNLGREDFLEKAERYAREVNLPNEHFFDQILLLLQSHTWQTAFCQQTLQSMKQNNIDLVRELISRNTNKLPAQRV